jgi:hypothetical protein
MLNGSRLKVWKGECHTFGMRFGLNPAYVSLHDRGGSINCTVRTALEALVINLFVVPSGRSWQSLKMG